MLQILGKPSSINVRKVLWTCSELDIPYELQHWGSGFRSTHDAEFLALNPNAMVPVIRDGAFVLWESNAICRYLAAQNSGTALLPSRARERALVEQWMDWQATELNNSWRYAFMALVRQSAAHGDRTEVTRSVGNWNRHMQMLEGQLQTTRAYVTGATFTLADIVLGLATNRWFMTPMQRPDLPAVAAYYERLSQRPGFLAHGRNGTP